MSLNQISERAIDAADGGDLEALTRALTDREAAIAELADSTSPEEQATDLVAAIKDGKAIDAAIVAFKLRLRYERGQLDQLKSGLMAGVGSPLDPGISYRG